MRHPIPGVLLLLPLIVAQASGEDVPVFRQVAGEMRERVVAQGDTLISLAAQLGVSWRALAAENRLSDPGRLRPGMVLSADTRRIVPGLVEDGIVVNIPEATLYYFEGGALAARYPVSLGALRSPTPVGTFSVFSKEILPGEESPRSLAQETESEARVVAGKALPDTETPLGKHWIQLSPWESGIHGTPFVSSLGRFLSYRCIRLGEKQMQDVFGRVRQGTRVDVIYAPVKLAMAGGRAIWAEAHRDVYGMGTADKESVMEALRREGLASHVDVVALEDVLRNRLGVARIVGTPPSQTTEARPQGGMTAVQDLVTWRCLDCPPGPNRRVTLQIGARVPVDLPNPFPIEVRDDRGAVVFRPQMLAQTLVHLESGEIRNFVWEVRDSSGQPLAPGSYSVSIRFFRDRTGTEQILSLPLWVGK